jgi:FixJ family two-component response regulator
MPGRQRVLKLKTGETIMVVARDGGLRRSYVFALQAEGFRVEPFASLTSALTATRYPRTICVLVDDSAMRGIDDSPDMLAQLGLPVILLVSGFGKALAEGSVPGEVLTKPLLGGQLVECIDRLRRRGAPWLR